MRKNIKIKALFVALMAVFSLWAQDSVLVKEVTVSQEFNPTVNDAYKLSSSPQIDLPESYTPSFEYGFFNAPLRTTYDIQFIGADEYFPPERISVGDQNYIKGGVGNYTTLFGELFYNAYNSEKQNVNLFFKNRSSWGDVTLQDKQKVDAPSINNYMKVDFQRRYRYSVMNSAISFKHQGYKYYGFHTLDQSQTYSYLDGDSVTLDNDKQSLKTITFDLGLQSLQRRGSDFQYKVDFAFNSTSNNDKFSENQFDVKGKVEKNLNAIDLGFDAYTNFGFYGDPVAGLSRQYVGDSYFDLEVAPYAAIRRDTWDILLGAKIEYYQMGSIQESAIAPIFDLNFSLVPKYFTGYLSMTGDIKQNTYAQVAYANPFIANDLVRKPTRTLFDVGGGLVGHPTKQLSMKLGLNYKKVEDMLLYVNEFVTDDVLATNDEAYTNRFQALYDDSKIWTFRGEVNYNTYNKWSISAAIDYNNYTMVNEFKAWNLPVFKISAFGHYDVNDKIRVKGTFEYLPERAVKVSQSNGVDYLSSTYDFTLNGEYKYKENISFFLDMNNMLGSKYYHFNGYPAYRFNALVGATFRF